MSSEALYEQYKDALKRGHVAALRGHVDEALVAYADAARIAPERSTPHSSAGTALLRRKRPAEALRHYEVALKISPRDEAALLGRAQCLAAIDRRGDAADAFDALAEAQAASGRLADAVDAARRGLEMAEGRERRRTLERLIAKLRASEPGEPGRVALERALQVLDGVAVPHAESGPSTAAEAEMEATLDPDAEPDAVADAESPAVAAEPEPVVPSTPSSRELPQGATAAELDAKAEAAADAGVPGPAVEALLDLAAFHARDSRIDAALDACYAAVSFDPDNSALHLALAELYAERGWTSLVAEKLDLLERLGELDGDRAALADLAAVRAALS